tara:strand:- start:873 stop:1196 length:324 start_codon:yes stop_codon:yes gene_type:complete
MKKYTVVYVANGRYDSPIDDPITRVEYIQGETLDDAIEGHIKYMKDWAIHDIVGEVAMFEGHIKQIDIGHGVGHRMMTNEDVIITGVNNGSFNDLSNAEGGVKRDAL